MRIWATFAFIWVILFVCILRVVCSRVVFLILLQGSRSLLLCESGRIPHQVPYSGCGIFWNFCLCFYLFVIKRNTKGKRKKYFFLNFSFFCQQMALSVPSVKFLKGPASSPPAFPGNKRSSWPSEDEVPLWFKTADGSFLWFICALEKQSISLQKNLCDISFTSCFNTELSSIPYFYMYLEHLVPILVIKPEFGGFLNEENNNDFDVRARQCWKLKMKLHPNFI